MSKAIKSASQEPEKTLPLIDLIEATKAAPKKPGAYDVAAEIRGWASAALKGSPKSRYQVAAEMSELIGIEITKSMLDAWTAESKEGHRLPVEFVPAFCTVTNNYGIFDICGRLLGGRFFTGLGALDAPGGPGSGPDRGSEKAAQGHNQAAGPGLRRKGELLMDIKERQKNIKIWLIQKGKIQSEIARETGASQQSVSWTIAGHRNDPKVLAWLREHGCPEEFMRHPKEKKAEEKRAA